MQQCECDLVLLIVIMSIHDAKQGNAFLLEDGLHGVRGSQHYVQGL